MYKSLRGHLVLFVKIPFSAVISKLTIRNGKQNKLQLLGYQNVIERRLMATQSSVF